MSAVPQSSRSAFRALSTQFEATYGAEIAPLDPPSNYVGLHFEDMPSSIEPRTQLNDSAEKNGSFGKVPTSMQTVTWGLAGNHKRRLKPTDIALLASTLLCDVSSETLVAGAYKHRMLLRESQVDLRSRTMIEFDGVNKNIFAGIVAKSLSLKSSRTGFVDFSAALLGRGSYTVTDTAKPAPQLENYFYCGDVKLYLGATYAAETYSASGGTNVSTELTEVSIEIGSNAEPIDPHGHNTGYAARVDADEFTFKVSTSFEFDTDSWLVALKNGTTYCLHFPIVGTQIGSTGQYYTVELIFPKAQIKGLTPGENKSTILANVEWEILRDVDNDYPPVVLNVINAVEDIGAPV